MSITKLKVACLWPAKFSFTEAFWTCSVWQLQFTVYKDWKCWQLNTCNTVRV